MQQGLGIIGLGDGCPCSDLLSSIHTTGQVQALFLKTDQDPEDEIIQREGDASVDEMDEDTVAVEAVEKFKRKVNKLSYQGLEAVLIQTSESLQITVMLQGTIMLCYVMLCFLCYANMY